MPVNYVSPIEKVYFDSTSLNPAIYQAINTYGLDEACTMIRIINTSDVDIYMSYDGVHDHDYVRAYKSHTLNLQLNATGSGDIAKMKKYSKVYIKGSVPKFGGYIYLVGYY